MLTAYRAAPLRKLGYHHIARRQVINSHRDGHDIRDRVNRTHLVEMHLVSGAPVGGGLGFGEDVEDATGNKLRSWCHVGRVDDGAHLSQATVLMRALVGVSMFMCMFMSEPICAGVLVITLVCVREFAFMSMSVFVFMGVSAYKLAPMNMFVFVFVFVFVPMLAPMNMCVCVCVFVFVRMFVSMSMRMKIALLPSMLMLARAPMQIGHVVIMVLVSVVEHHVEVAYVKPRLQHTRDAYLKPADGKALQRATHLLLACADIQQRRRAHVAAYARRALQIKYLPHDFAFRQLAGPHTSETPGQRSSFLKRPKAGLPKQSEEVPGTRNLEHQARSTATRPAPNAEH